MLIPALTSLWFGVPCVLLFLVVCWVFLKTAAISTSFAAGSLLLVYQVPVTRTASLVLFVFYVFISALESTVWLVLIVFLCTWYLCSAASFFFFFLCAPVFCVCY